MYVLSEETLREITIRDANDFGHNHPGYGQRRKKIVTALYPEVGVAGFRELLRKLYESPMSCHEIAEKILTASGETITARSIERAVKKAGGKTRGIGEAFGLAIKKGRVNWVYKEMKKKKGKQLSAKTRMEILKRDNFTCVLCGAGKEACLEIDHIVPRVRGGSNEPENLRILCHECNVGKGLSEGEGA
jgi:rubredoxin